ncbi:MAG TPA: hypothetical protein VF702_05220 [Allosphingosinicella sp.]|jgi:hypothetical protein
MDAGARNPYVRLTRRPIRRPDLDLPLELLLFLSAMVAGLTGLISGDRDVEAGRVARPAMASAAPVEIAAIAVEAAAHSRPTRPAVRFAAPAEFAPPPAPQRRTPREAAVDGRRLE